MTAADFLDAWAATPDSEMFLGVKYGEKWSAAGRLKAGDFGRIVFHGHFGQLEKLATDPNFLSSARVDSIKGVTCLIIEGEVAAPWERPVRSPSASRTPQDYCVVLAPVDVFAV